MSAATCVNCGASAVVLDADGRCAGCPLPITLTVERLVARGKSQDEMRARLAARRAEETDPVQREAYALAARAGFDWFDTESMARRAFEHAATELVPLRADVERLKKQVSDMRAAEHEREREFSRELRDAVAEAEHNAREDERHGGF